MDTSKCKDCGHAVRDKKGFFLSCLAHMSKLPPINCDQFITKKQREEKLLNDFKK